MLCSLLENGKQAGLVAAHRTPAHDGDVRQFVIFLAPFIVACSAADNDNAPENTAMTDDGAPLDGPPTEPGTGGAGAGGTASGVENLTTGGAPSSQTGGASPTGGMPNTGGSVPVGAGGTPAGPPLPTCDTPLEDGGNQVGCQSTVEGLDVKYFWPPAEPTSPSRLGVYLHGDGAGDWDNPFYIERLAEWAVPRGIMIVAPLSPGIHEDGSHRWWVESSITVPMLQDTLQYFVDSYALSTDTVFYAGVSGGAQFMSAQWLHRAGHLFPGAFAHNCGGTDPSTSYEWAWDSNDAALRSRFSLHFNYGSEDFLASQGEDAIADYTALGFTVTSLVHPGAQHCAHEIVQPTLDFWETQLN